MNIKNIILLTFMFIITLWNVKANIVVVGNIPDRYLSSDQVQSTQKYHLGYVHIQDRLIKEVSIIENDKAFKELSTKFADSKIIYSTLDKSISSTSNYDFVYPGLIDLHNHTKQNNLGVWDLAVGQFKNRFEWRAWTPYKYSVSGNMNPWIGYSKAIQCAAFRWSEMQAMVLGVTFLQGPSSCIKDFAIHQVEDNSSYITKKTKVMAPTDLVIPADMTYVWDVLRPLIQKGMSYEEALAKDIADSCELDPIDPSKINGTEALKILKDKNLLKEKCTKKKLHSKFLRYVYWVHPTIAGRKRFLKSSKRSAIIAHLAEGRRDDFYNQREFEIVKLLGLDHQNVNFVHGVGIKPEDIEYMGKKKMGLIWSLYSNLLLYGQTLDIKKAKEAGITLALGSDWLPTGSRGVLEELKLAARYVDKDPEGQKLSKIFTDEELYLMVNENPARLINHFDIIPEKKEHGIGQIKVGAMGSIITATKINEDPYTNLVRHVWAKDINLVLIDGNPTYGNEVYFNKIGIADTSYEKMPMYLEEVNSLTEDKSIAVLPEAGSTKSSKEKHSVEIAKYIGSVNFSKGDNCGFKVKKAFIHQDSFGANKDLKKFQDQTGLNLDRFEDIQKLLAVNLLTQSRNLNEPSKGKLEYAIKEFPPLYSCHDEKYLGRLGDFIVPGSDSDEFTNNQDPDKVSKLREEQGLGRVPDGLAKDYK